MERHSVPFRLQTHPSPLQTRHILTQHPPRPQTHPSPTTLFQYSPFLSTTSNLAQTMDFKTRFCFVESTVCDVRYSFDDTSVGGRRRVDDNTSVGGRRRMGAACCCMFIEGDAITWRSRKHASLFFVERRWSN